MAILTPIQDGMAGDPDLVMAWIKNGNYGTALPPMAQDGANTDNTLDLGTTTARWRMVNAGGVVAGTPVGSFTVPERRFARFALPGKDISGFPFGESIFFTIDISPLGRVAGVNCALTFVGDDFNFSAKTGTVVNNVQSNISYSANYGSADLFYNTFQIRIVDSTVQIFGVALWGGIYDYWGNYFVANPSNFDGTAQSRGWLDIEYTPL